MFFLSLISIFKCSITSIHILTETTTEQSVLKETTFNCESYIKDFYFLLSGRRGFGCEAASYFISLCVFEKLRHSHQIENKLAMLKIKQVLIAICWLELIWLQSTLSFHSIRSRFQSNSPLLKKSIGCHLPNSFSDEFPTYLKESLQKASKIMIAYTLITSFAPLTWIDSSQLSLIPPVAKAAVAPLADVGIKEFLVKDGSQFLRLSLPSGPTMKMGKDAASEPGKLVQESIELVRLRCKFTCIIKSLQILKNFTYLTLVEQVGVTNPSVWGSLLTDSTNAMNLLVKNEVYFTENSESKQIYSSNLIPSLNKLISAVKAKDASSTLELQDLTAKYLYNMRISMLPKKQLPFQIPEEYSSFPRLHGRAIIEMTIKSKSGFLVPSTGKRIPSENFLIEIDGYHAPLTGGNFIDLIDKKFYNNMPIQRAEQLVIQSGKDGGNTKTPMRKIPLEIFYKQDNSPTYGITSDDDLRATDALALPFQSYGALGMARENEDVDSADSQFFILKWSQALNPPGRNTLDGFYSCFGYVISNNAELLAQVTVDDSITSIKVAQGMDNLVRP